MATKKPTKPKTDLAVPPIPEKTLEELRSDDMDERANALVDILGNTLPAIPKSFRYSIKDQDRVRNAFDFAFGLIGGVPALALWGAQNPDKFYPLLAKMQPQNNNLIQTTGNVTVLSNIPDSPLNTPPTSYIDVDAEDGDDE